MNNNLLFEQKPSIKYQATPEAQSRFNTYVDNIDTVKLRYNNNELARRANVANAICELSSDYKGMFEISPDVAFASFFGLEDSKSIDTMESVLKRVRQHTKDSQNALAEFKKLSRDEQDRIVKEHSPNAKKKEVRAGIYGIPSSVEVDNPEYDSEKERAEYEEKLKAKNTWESYLNIRNNFSTEVVSDAMRFVQASNDRSEAAYAHIDKFLAKDFEYKEQFLSAIHAFNPEIRAGFIERVKTRIGEGWTDSGQNLRDYFVERNKDSRVLYRLAEEMGLVDKDGNLTANDNQLAELQKTYETKQNVELNRSMGAMGGMGMNNSVYKNTDVKKLFEEGKNAFERRKAIRTFLDANRTKFSYDKGEWQTFENALVNGEYALRSLLIGFGATALTKNAYAGVVATMPMMYAEEASSMYADLRFNKNIKESDAIAGALFYGTTSTLLEQLQFSRFSKFFTKGSFIPETFKQYLAHGVKEASLRLGKETAIETFVEFGQASLGFATKAWAKNHTDDFELQPLWEEYCTEVSEVFKTMPIITTLMFGVGTPFRARGYLKNVGADFGSAIKGVYKSSDVLNNNIKAKGTIDLANQYFEDVKSKLGNTASGREWLGKYFSTTTEKEKHALLNERFSDDNERYKAKMMLDQLADIDSKATQEWVKIKVEAAKKRADEANKILRGDTTDISLFDNEIVNEKGNRSYEVLESAIDALNMRSVVASVNTAQELSEIAGVSLQEAEEIMSRKGAKGFFDEKDGKIIVINPHFKNGVDALQSFVHEYGHKIMKHIRETDANGYKRMCDNVLMLVGGEDFARSLLPASYSQEGHTNYEATAQGIAEETLMRVIEQVAYKKVLDTKKRSVWEHFKGWFKKFFDEKSLADITNEQLAEMALDVLQREKAFDVSLSSKPSKNWRAKTPEADGAEVSGEWVVMDASELLASTDKGYDDALQPRNRSRQSSKEQVLSIANNLDPERLDNDPTTSDGAPIIDDRNMVVSGNGRILAIRQAYEFGKADEYRRHVQNRAKAMGVDIPKNIKNPVLVRKVNNTGEMSIEELAARSNKSSVAGMSVAEQAVADGRRIIEHNLLEIFYPSADGNILAESNRDFNNAFLYMVGGGELYRNKDGSLRANLAPRVKAGVLAAMLNNDGNRDIVERLLDNPEGYSALINGLMQCAANVAELTQKPMYDVSGDLSQAVELYIEMHEKGQTVAEFSAQMDMFREKPSDEVMFLCKLFEDNQRTSSGISGVLKEYASQCKKIDTATANLFGEDDPSKLEKLQSAYNHYATDIANQGGESTLKAKYEEEMPSPEEIAEALRQYDEVVAKYKGTPQWLKAPNGKPTKLTEAQWIWVRTPNFKKWFGDWETLAEYEFLNGKEVAQIIGDEILGSNKNQISLSNVLSYWSNKYKAFKRKENEYIFNSKATSVDVIVNENTIKATISKNGRLELKNKALACIGEIIENGIPLNFTKNWKDRGHQTFILSAPIKIAEDMCVASVVVKRPRAEKHRDGTEIFNEPIAYIIDAIKIERLVDKINPVGQLNAMGIDVNKSTNLVDYVLKNIFSVKQKDVSKVVDENGEPLVVYHGTKWNALKEPQGKAIFDIGKSGKSNDNISKIGFWFTPSKIIADDFSYNWYGNGEPEILDVFLNLKNPKIYREVDNSEELSKVKKEIEDAKNDIKKIEKETPRLNQLLGLVPRKTFYETEDEYNKAVENYFKTAEGYLFEKSDAENAIEFIKLKEKLDLLHFDRRVLENSDSYDQFRNDLDEFSDYKYQSISKGVISYKRGSHLSNFAIYNTNEAVEKLKNKLLNEGYDGVIVKDTVYDAKGHGVSQYVAFEPNQIKSATDNVGTFSQSNDIRWKVEEQIETPQFNAWFGNSKVVDANGKPLHVYHGTSRGDRVGDIFDPKRATSGPMAFFTDNKDIATNYATDKNDTSIDADGLFDSYDSRFFFINDDGQKMPLSEAWLKIPFDKRKTITEKAKHITLDDDGENAIYDKNAKDGAGSFSFNLMEARNNVFQALYAEWLDSGYLMRDDEVKFLEVLKLAGVENVEYLDPYKKEPKVYDVFLRIEKPFDTSKISKTDIAGLKRAAKKAQKSYNPENSRKVDSWDKNSISPEDWIKKLERDLEIWKTYSWIQIPDFVTDYLKSKGYDGIKDKGGKNTDIGHTVWIPFSSVQIKDATGANNGDFSLDNPSIKWKVDAKAEADAWASNPENVRKAAEEYLSKQKRQIVVDPDEIRKLVPNYDISNNSAFVSAGDEILEVVWAEALKKAPKDKTVVLLTGNPAAGKSSVKEHNLLKELDSAGVVFDAPQNSFESVEKRVGQAVDAGHKVDFIQIYNDPITSWENSLKRGISKGRYLPLKYFVERAYERAQDKVAKIENELKSKYGEKLRTKYIDNKGNNPIVVSPKEALAWDYSVSDEQLKQIENITYEYKGKIEESSRIRGDKENPLTVIRQGLLDAVVGLRFRGFAERISGRNESSSLRKEQSLSSQTFDRDENSTRLKALLRQERSENPVIWASIVLAKEILRGRAITGTKLEKVLPSGKFDGTQRQYAIDRAKLIAEQCKATQEDYINRLDQAVKLAENDVYWTRDIVQEMNNSFRRDGEEYGIVRQKLTQWLKDEQRKDLEKVKGLTSSELGIDVAEAIENALEAEPERKKSESSVEEETEEEVSDDAEEGIDNELMGAVEKLAPSNIREIISKVRIGVLKAVKAKGGDEQTRRRVYRNTLVEVLREATKQLTYGKEREAIFAKISELATKGYAVIKIKDGERAGQKIDNYTLRAEHIALRIFNRGVRDTKEALLEKFEKLLKHVKAPARVKRDDKRKMTGKSEERAYIIKQIAYMPLNSDNKTVKSVESEIENTLSVINKADSTMANDYNAKLINAVQYLEDLQRFGALKEKSRAEMAEAIEWIEKFLESETEQHAEKVEKLKEDADRRRKIFLDAINENDHNANFDGKVRESFRYLLNSGSTFKDLLLGLGRSATGEKSAKFRKLVEEMMNDCYRATAEKENEVFKFQNELTEVVKEIYGMNASDAFKHLLGSNEKLQEFSIQGKPMSVQIALQRLSMAEQRNYEHNVYIHCCGRSKEAKKIEQRIDELEQQKAETTAVEILKQIRADIKKLENELETIERNSVAEYVEKLRSALSEQDLKLLDWFREFYSREREHLSDANEVITGLGVPEADPLYTPMKMLREGGTNEKHQVVAIVPKSLSPRVPNALDMDENIGIVDIWNERIAENAHYKAFSQLNIQWRGIFAHADFHKAVNTKLGKNVLTQVLDHFNDIMSVSVFGGLTIDSIDKLNGLYAIAALGFNLSSGLRQMTGASAFANFVGAKNTFKYTKDCLSKEGRQASIEILKSDIAKRRMQSGNNQVLLEALNNIEDNKFWAWYKRNAMFFNRWGDVLPILTIGQGIYRSKTEEYAKSMSIEEAKKKAMNEMWAIAEASQQSPSVMNMGTWQRRGGSFGKAAGLFISSPQLMLSREVEVFNRFVSVRQKYKNNPNDESIRKDYFEARKALAKTFFINHVLVQGGYMVATALWKALLGDDWDDDDCWAILAETIAGPLGGLVVFGRFVSAFYSNFSVSAMPIEGFGRTVKASVDLVQDLIMLDGEEITKDLDRIAKSLFAPYRDGRKIYKNATDDKDGLVW